MSEVGAPIVGGSFDTTHVFLGLADGRMLATPLAWAGPAVTTMDASARAGWVLTDNGRGINRPAAGHADPDGILNVWTLEEHGLYDDALRELQEADWQTDALPPRTRSLVALWRLVADGTNGGLIQFFTNWGANEIDQVLRTLDAIGAVRTFAIVREFWEVVGPLATSDKASAMDDVWTAVADAGLVPRLDEIDRAFWEAAPELTRRVPNYFGPAPSVVHEASDFEVLWQRILVDAAPDAVARATRARAAIAAGGFDVELELVVFTSNEPPWLPAVWLTPTGPDQFAAAQAGGDDRQLLDVAYGDEGVVHLNGAPDPIDGLF